MKHSRIFRSMLGAALAVCFAAAPIAASAQEEDVLGLGGLTPAGNWISDNGDSRYQVELCGDGTQLCAKLTWIRPRDRNERNVQYVDQWAIYEADRHRPTEWRGNLNVYGTDYGGSVRIVDENRIQLTGCILILCESYMFHRLDEDMQRVVPRQG